MLNKINLQLFAEEDIETDTSVVDEVDVEVAEPQADEDTNSDDVDTEVIEDDTDVETDDTETIDDTDTKPKQSKDVDSAFKKIRNRADEAERKAKELEAQIQRDEQVRSNFAEYGVYSEADISKKYGESHGIHTFEDMQRQVLEDEYKEKGIDPNLINKMIDNHPAVKEAQKLKDNAMIASQYNQLVNDLKDDGLDVVKTPSDVPKAVYDKWNYGKNGLTLSDCYYLSQRKNIESKKISATKQATLNNLNGKKHLKTQGDGTSSASDVSVPNETLTYYMDMGMSKKEATAHYKKLYK